MCRQLHHTTLHGVSLQPHSGSSTCAPSKVITQAAVAMETSPHYDEPLNSTMLLNQNTTNGSILNESPSLCHSLCTENNGTSRESTNIIIDQPTIRQGTGTVLLKTAFDLFTVAEFQKTTQGFRTESESSNSEAY